MYDKETVENIINTLKAGILYLQLEGKEEEAIALLNESIQNFKEVIKRTEKMIVNLKGDEN